MTIKKFCLTILSVLLSAILLTSCATKPVYYTEEQIKQYVSRVYGDSWEYDTSPSEHEYCFTNTEGLSFSVYATNIKPISIDGASASVYQKAVKDNYFEAIYQQKAEAIEALAAAYNVSFQPRFYRGEILLLLDSEDKAEDVAECIAELDHLLDYQCKYRKARLRFVQTMQKNITVALYVQPEDAGENWTYQYENCICEITLSTNAKKRLDKQKCKRRIDLNSEGELA